MGQGSCGRKGRAALLRRIRMPRCISAAGWNRCANSVRQKICNFRSGGHRVTVIHPDSLRLTGGDRTAVSFPLSHSVADWHHAMLALSLRDLLNRAESTQPAAHGFYRMHDNSRDVRGSRANPGPSAIRPLHRSLWRPLSASDPVVRDGLFTLDALVTETTGNPVSNLAPWDFTLLDAGQRTRIRTFHNSLEASQPAPELIFVLDAINLSPQQLTQTESAILHFLRQNGGHLEFPCRLYRLTREGLFSSLRSTKDGALLAKELEQKRSQWAVWRAGRNDGPNLLRSWEGGSQPSPLSLRALGSIAIDQRESPAAKSCCGSVPAGL